MTTTDEKMLFSNTFGSVTDKRVILNYKNGAEDLPISKITSVSLKHNRNSFFAIGSFVAALILLVMLVSMSPATSDVRGVFVVVMLILIIVAILSGIANWIGHHSIIISSAGNNRKPLKVEMAKTQEGKQFVDAVKNVIIQ